MARAPPCCAVEGDRSLSRDLLNPEGGYISARVRARVKVVAKMGRVMDPTGGGGLHPLRCYRGVQRTLPESFPNGGVAVRYNIELVPLRTYALPPMGPGP